MKPLVLFALLLSASLGAQTVDPNELTYGPFLPGPRDTSFSVAVAPHGLLLAWSEADSETGLASIRTGLLNHDAQLIGSIHTISPANNNRSATTPVVATNGESFFVAWIERDASSYTPRGVAGVLTDATGQPGETSRVIGPPPESDTSPALVWDGIGYRVHAAPRRVPFATPQANGWVDWTPVPSRSNCVWSCRWPPTYTKPEYILDWAILTRDWIRTGRQQEIGYTSRAPAIIATGDDLLVIWSTDGGLKAMRIVDGELSTTFRLEHYLAARSAPAMAGSLVVFAQNGDIFGSVINGDTFGAPFEISTGESADDLPRVFQVSANRYLVTYVRADISPTVKLAGRFVTIE
jgi:hypothetical protein